MKNIPNINLNLKDSDKSQTNPNKSDLRLKGDHNQIHVSSSSDIRQRKNPSLLLSVFLFALINACLGVFIFVAHDHYSTKRNKIAQEQHKELQRSIIRYTDSAIIKAVTESNEKFSDKIEKVLSEVITTAQEGNRNIIRVQLIREYDEYLIDGKTEIRQRDLDGLKYMYNYYILIGGNHDIPPRDFQFNQMIAKKQIIVIE